MPVASVRVRISDLTIDWLQAVTDLVCAIDEHDPLDVPHDVLTASERVRRVMLTPDPDPPGERRGEAGR